MHLEANQAQRIVADDLIRTTSLPIFKYTTGTEKNTLDKAVPSLRIWLGNEKFRIPRGDRRSCELTDVWIWEMHNCTRLNGRMASVGGHDGTVMATYLYEQALRRGGFSVSFGDDGGSETAEPVPNSVAAMLGVVLYGPGKPAAAVPNDNPGAMSIGESLRRYHEL